MFFCESFILPLCTIFCSPLLSGSAGREPADGYRRSATRGALPGHVSLHLRLTMRGQEIKGRRALIVAKITERELMWIHSPSGKIFVREDREFTAQNRACSRVPCPQLSCVPVLAVCGSGLDDRHKVGSHLRDAMGCF